MSVCVRINGKKRKLCAADLDRLITFQDREITTPAGEDDTDYGEDFDNLLIDEDDVWAMILTRPNGTTFFDTVTNVEVSVDIEIYTRFLEGISAQTWILFEDTRYRILHTEDLEKRHEWLKLTCNERGSKDNAVNAA